MSPFDGSVPTRLLTIDPWLGSVVATRRHLVISSTRYWFCAARRGSQVKNQVVQRFRPGGPKIPESRSKDFGGLVL